jgi:hypothetical protein
MMGVDQLIGLCVPEMGMHALDAEEMAKTTTFRGTMVAGYYAGKPIFTEPMVTREMLLEKKSFDLAMPDIAGLGMGSPTAFRAEYDAGTNAYRFTFSGFHAAM